MVDSEAQQARLGRDGALHDRDVIVPGVADTVTKYFHGTAQRLEGEHAALGSHQLGQAESVITNVGSDVQDPVTGANQLG